MNILLKQNNHLISNSLSYYFIELATEKIFWPQFYYSQSYFTSHFALTEEVSNCLLQIMKRDTLNTSNYEQIYYNYLFKIKPPMISSRQLSSTNGSQKLYSTQSPCSSYQGSPAKPGVTNLVKTAKTLQRQYDVCLWKQLSTTREKFPLRRQQSAKLQLQPWSFGAGKKYNNHNLNRSLMNFAYKCIQKIEEWPYCSIGLVVITDTDDKVYNGVGTLISGNVVLTCAHHVYDTRTNTQPKSVKFVLGVEGVFYTSSYKVTKWFYPNEYRQIPYDNDAYDYAVLLLDVEDLSDEYGYLGVSVDLQDTQQQVEIVGYRANKIPSEGKNMWSASSNFAIVESQDRTNRIMQYLLPSHSCQGGSPILYQCGNSWKIVGIHSLACSKDLQSNRGVVFHRRAFEDINKWTKKIKYECKGVKQIEQSIKIELADKIEYINLNSESLKQQQVKMIAERSWSHLRELDLSGCRLGDAGFEILMTGNSLWPSLQLINLRGNKLTAKSMEFLVRNSWDCLDTLILTSNSIGIEGVELLLKNQWNFLKSLSLDGNGVNAKCLQKIIQYKWPNLQTLSAIGNGISAAEGSSIRTLAQHIRPTLKLYL